MKKEWKPVSLKHKVIVTIVLIAIYPILLMMILGYLNYERVLKERFIMSNLDEMHMTVNYINKDLINMDDFILTLLGDQGFYDLTKNNDKNQVSALSEYSFKMQVERYLNSVIYSNKDFDAGGIIFLKNEMMLYETEKTGMLSYESIPKKALLGLFEDEKTSKAYLIEEQGTTINIYLARKVLDKERFTPFAVLFFRIDTDYLKDLIGVNDSKNPTTTFMVTKDGKVLSQRINASPTTILNGLDLYKYSDGEYEVNFEEEDYYVLVTTSKEMDFKIISVTNKQLLLADMRKITDLIVILSFINLPIYVLIGQMLYRQIISPLNQLIGGMKSFKLGELGIKVKTKRKDEMGYLIHTFNDMTSSINTLVKEVYSEELARKDAEIASLQEQINPHFLYNTLESINWRAQLAGEQEIAEMIQALSKLMDGSINRDLEKFSPIEKEVYYMDQYMYLIKMRFGEKITYTKDIAGEALHYAIPKLIIQPLLENAVKHGIEPVGKGSILLKVWADDTLNIQVSDDGKGMLENRRDTVVRLFNLEKNYISDSEKRHSIGIQNVARRLVLIYGEQVHIDVESRLNHGTSITLRIPIKELKHE